MSDHWDCWTTGRTAGGSSSTESNCSSRSSPSKTPPKTSVPSVVKWNFCSWSDLCRFSRDKIQHHYLTTPYCQHFFSPLLLLILLTNLPERIFQILWGMELVNSQIRLDENTNQIIMGTICYVKDHIFSSIWMCHHSWHSQQYIDEEIPHIASLSCKTKDTAAV